MITESGLSESSRPCGVSGCDAVSRYECPRCHLPYCTASCYGAHSSVCVDAFSRANATDLRLKGVKTSEWERRRFNGIVQKIRDAGFYGGGYEDPVVDDDDDDDERIEEIEEEEEEVDADELPGLLEQFMNSLDDDGKKLVFSMINTGMEERYEESKRETQEKTATDREATARGQGVSESDEDKPTGKQGTENREKPTLDIADILEELLHDMEFRNLSYEQILDRLPEGMARDFEARLRDGRASRLLKLWRPWWIVHVESDEFVAKGDVEEEEQEGDIPPLPTADQLLVPVQVPRKRASVFIMYSVVDVLAAYCLSLRLCNGDWEAESSHVARKIWELSPVLGEDARYKSVEEACGCSFRKIVQVDKSTDAATEALNDVSAVVSGRSEWVTRALFQCQQILEAALEDTSSSGKKHLKARAKKVAYFVSWALCQDTQSFVTTARAVLSYVQLERGRCDEVKVADRAVRLAKKSAMTGSRITVVE